MQTKMKLITLSVATIAIFTACSQKEPTPKYSEKQIKQEAKVAIKTVASKLQGNLVHKIKEGGFEKAAMFCSTNAMTIAKKASKSLPKGTSLKRITTKPRNKMSQATKEQVLVLKELEEKIKSGEKIDMLVKQKAENHFEVYKPILIAGACLNCHGDKSSRNEKAYSIISQKYPQDKAIDYKLGDFRGAFLVNIIK